MTLVKLGDRFYRLESWVSFSQSDGDPGVLGYVVRFADGAEVLLRGENAKPFSALITETAMVEGPPPPVPESVPPATGRPHPGFQGFPGKSEIPGSV